MRKTYKHILPLFLSFLLLLTGCGASSIDKNMEQSTDSSMAGDMGWEGTLPDSEVSEEETTEADDTLPENDLAHRKLIRTVHLNMQTKAFDDLTKKLEASITQSGGYIENSSLDIPQYEDARRNCSLIIRIPSDKLDSFLSLVGTLGTITYQSETKEDVTLDYVDITTLKESLTIEYDRVTQLLTEATDLEQILVLESKLSDLRYELNRLESRIRTYDNLIDYSTVYLDIHEVEFEKVVEESIGSQIQNRFIASLYTVRDFFVDLVISFAGNFPVILLAAMIIGLFLLIIFKCNKRRKRKAAEKQLKQNLGNTPLTPPASIKDAGLHEDNKNK